MIFSLIKFYELQNVCKNISSIIVERHKSLNLLNIGKETLNYLASNNTIK